MEYKVGVNRKLLDESLSDSAYEGSDVSMLARQGLRMLLTSRPENTDPDLGMRWASHSADVVGYAGRLYTTAIAMLDDCIKIKS